jgi:hypothetical protein
MNILNDIGNWVFSDPTQLIWIVAGIAVLGGIIGFKRSLDHCKGSWKGRIL